MLSSSYLAYESTVKDFKYFIESEFTQALHWVAEEGRGPAEAESSDSALLDSNLEPVEDIAIFCWIYLNTAFDQI